MRFDVFKFQERLNENKPKKKSKGRKPASKIKDDRDVYSYIKDKEGYAGVLQKETEYTGLKGKPDSKIKGTGKYGYYYDSGGKLTRGFGKLVTEKPDEEDIKKYGEQKAKKELTHEVDNFKKKLEKQVGQPLSNFLDEEEQKGVLSYYYNVGINPKHKSIKNLKKAAEAATLFSRDKYLKESVKEMDINTVGGKFSQGLENRREEERSFATPKDITERIKAEPIYANTEIEKEPAMVGRDDEKTRIQRAIASIHEQAEKQKQTNKQDVMQNSDRVIKTVARDENLTPDQREEVVKTVANPEAVKQSVKRNAQEPDAKQSMGLKDQFLDALTFFGPQLLGGFLASGGKQDEYFVAGFEQGGKARDTYLTYLNQKRDLDIKEREAVQNQGMTPYQQQSLQMREQELEQRKLEEERRMQGFGLSKQKFGFEQEKFGFTKEQKSELSDAQVKQLQDMVSVEKSIARIEEIRQQYNETGPIAGRVQSIAQLADLAPEEFTRMKVQTASTLSNYVKSISGAQVTEQEAQRLQAIIPSVNDAPDVFEQKLKEFERIVKMNKEAFAEAIRTGQPLKAGKIKGLTEAESKSKNSSIPTDDEIDNMSLEELKERGLI